MVICIGALMWAMWIMFGTPPGHGADIKAIVIALWSPPGAFLAIWAVGAWITRPGSARKHGEITPGQVANS